MIGVVALDIAVREVHKYYGSEHILKGMTFEVYKGEKVGLLGKNGAGKTTLFKILSGVEAYDDGTVNLSGKAGILDQIPEYPHDYTVLDVLKTSFERLSNIKNEMKELEKLMAVSSNATSNAASNTSLAVSSALSSQPSIVKRYGVLQTEFEAMGGYTIDSDIAKICNGLGIDKDMQDRLFIHLSGGEKTRINLGRIILQNPVILLLDEPTNHLDINMTEWLEDYLSQYKGTVLAISHDRYFLDRVVQRIVEIVDGKAEFYEGNYSYYVKEKESRYLQKLQQYEQEQRKIRQLEEAARKMHQWASVADNPSMHRRAFAIEKRIEKMERTDRPTREKGIKSVFKGIRFAGNDVIVIKGLRKSFNARCIIDDINLTVEKGDRIGLIGNNGCGKTTLLRLITGEETPDSGFSRIGTSIKYAFLPQIVVFDNPELTVLDTVRNALIVSEEAARNRLAAYHFKGEEVFKQVSTLSGGEKSRLKLCILMNSDINLLILDEPTNHLDIVSREWIEEAIDGYDGTLLFVSHDRYLVNRFATRIWDMEDGSISDFRGTYESYRKWKTVNNNKTTETVIIKAKKNINAEKNNNAKKNNNAEKNNNTEKNKKNKDNKAIENKGWKSKRERQVAGRLRELERDILILEERLKDIEIEMEQRASDYESLQTLLEEKDELNLNLDSLYMEWGELSE